MKAITPVLPHFPEAAIVHHGGPAVGQDEYFTLPTVVLAGDDQQTISRWQLTPEEMRLLLRGGNLYLTQLTFGQRLQPVRLSVTPPPIDIITPTGVQHVEACQVCLNAAARWRGLLKEERRRQAHPDWTAVYCDECAQHITAASPDIVEVLPL